VGRLKIYDPNISRANILAERENVYLSRSTEQKIHALLNLNRISVQMNGGKPLKMPQGKGLVISRTKV